MDPITAVDPRAGMLHFSTVRWEAQPLQTAHLSLLAAARPGGAPHVSVLLGSGPQHEQAVQSLLATLAPGARILRVGNPLRSPLTIERILIQGGQPEVGLLAEDAAEEAMQRLCIRRPGESRVVLVIDQAETLSASAIRVLSRLVAPGGRPSTGMDALLACRPGWPALVQATGQGQVGSADPRRHEQQGRPCLARSGGQRGNRQLSAACRLGAVPAPAVRRSLAIPPG